MAGIISSALGVKLHYLSIVLFSLGVYEIDNREVPSVLGITESEAHECRFVQRNKVSSKLKSLRSSNLEKTTLLPMF